MISELFQVVSYSYQPSRPLNLNKNNETGGLEKKQLNISASASASEQNQKNVIPVKTEKSLLSQL